jgi:cell division control protein 6
LIRKGIPQNALIQGRIGTGKTTLAKRFCHELEAAGKRSGRRIVAEVVTCRSGNTSSEVLHRLLALRFDEHLQERGFSAPQLLDILWQKLSKKRIHLVIVLDEAEKLFRTEGPILVYGLTRFNKEMEPARESISVVLASISDAWEFMDPVAASMFVPQNVIHLIPFTNRELVLMLQNITESGLRPGTWDRKTLELVIQFSAMVGGDFRRVRELLYGAARLAEEERAKKISFKHVQGAHSIAARL